MKSFVHYDRARSGDAVYRTLPSKRDHISYSGLQKASPDSKNGEYSSRIDSSQQKDRLKDSYHSLRSGDHAGKKFRDSRIKVAFQDGKEANSSDDPPLYPNSSNSKLCPVKETQNSGRSGTWNPKSNPLHDHLLKLSNAEDLMWRNSSVSTPSPTHSGTDSEVVTPLLGQDRESAV